MPFLYLSTVDLFGLLSYPAASLGSVDEALAVLDEALSQCLAVPLWARTPQQLAGYLDRVQALEQRLLAVKLALVREVDALGVAQQQGAANMVAWLRDRHRISGGAAHRTVKLAKALDKQLPAVARAVADGVVNVEQAQLIAAAVARVPAEVRAQAEARLVADAAVFGPRELGRLGERVLAHVAPELAAERAEEELARLESDAYHGRELHVVDAPGTCRVRVHGYLDREGGAVLRAALDPLTTPCGTKDEPDLRGPEQRRADALVEICRRVLATGELPDNGGDRPQLVVTVDYDTLRGQLGAATLDDGGQLSADIVRRLACDAAVIPVVLGGAGQVLDVGRERRLFTGPLRRALVARDGGCALPGV